MQEDNFTNFHFFMAFWNLLLRFKKNDDGILFFFLHKFYFLNIHFSGSTLFKIYFMYFWCFSSFKKLIQLIEDKYLKKKKKKHLIFKYKDDENTIIINKTIKIIRKKNSLTATIPFPKYFAFISKQNYHLIHCTKHWKWLRSWVILIFLSILISYLYKR